MSDETIEIMDVLRTENKALKARVAELEAESRRVRAENQRMVKEWELVEMKCNLSVARLVTTVDIDWLQRVMIRALQGGE